MSRATLAALLLLLSGCYVRVVPECACPVAARPAAKRPAPRYVRYYVIGAEEEDGF